VISNACVTDIIWTFGNIDCLKTHAVKSWLVLVPHWQCRVLLHHGKDQLCEEVDGVW